MDELLIEQVRIHDNLYNSKSKNYRDQNIRRETWRLIGIELKVSGAVAKNRWDKLRRCYLNARNRTQCRKSKDGGKSTHSWKFEEQMSFLIPYGRKAQSNVIDYLNIDKVETDLDNLLDDTQLLQNIKEELEPGPNVGGNTQNEKNDKKVSLRLIQRRKKARSGGLIPGSVNVSQTKRRFEEKRSNTTKAEMDETDMFFMSMSKMTKQLEPIEQAKIKLQLSTAVLNAQIKMSESQEHCPTRCLPNNSERPFLLVESVQEDATETNGLYCEVEDVI